MIKNQPIIGVSDVEKSSTWYQQVLNCKSGHGGDEFEMLQDNSGETFLCLHKWGEHDHPTLGSPKIKAGNGLILYITVEDLKQCFDNAKNLNAQIESPIQINPNSNREEFAVRDLDGYYIIITK